MGSEAIFGTCLSMCPDSEIRERERAGLIHFLEKSDDPLPPETFHNSGRGRGRGGRPQLLTRGIKPLVKADREKSVKSYTRPAAGVNKSNPSDLRPPHVLKKTVAYLCIKVLTRTDRSFIEVYDFVFDRLRAVRQDMVIQRICDDTAILILESIVKFHLYAEYRFRKEAPINYDPVINQKHLRDCLKTLLSFYGISDFNGPSRPFFEALYCLMSPESYEVISRAFTMKSKTKESPVFQSALQICLAIQNHNFYRFFQLLDELPPLLAGYVVQRVPSMRMHALRAIATTYGVKTCKIPLQWIEELLCYPNTSRVEQDLIKVGSQIIRTDEGNGGKFVKFDKATPLIKTDHEIILNIDVKFIILGGLNNLEVIANEQICPWGRNVL